MFFNILIPLCIISFIIILLIIRNIIKKQINSPFLTMGTAHWIGDREEQEDSFSMIENESGFMAVLADGMGGISSGKLASEFAVHSFLEEFTRNYYIKAINDFLINTTHICNYNLLKMAAGENMGTTLIAVLIKDNYLHWVSVGDSQIYLYSNKHIHSLNSRHTYALTLNEAYKNGEISREKAFNHPRRGRLISYLGYKDFHLLDYSKSPIFLNKNDKIILCSDGIYNNLTDYEFEMILSERNKPEKDAENIMFRVKDKNVNNQDNATVIVLERNR
ncbi:MAG: PP2C family protein-serine/threonine phosphatase [bacterium]